MYVLLFYFISVGYCVWRLSKTWKKNDLGGGLGISPATDMMMVVFLAPFLMIVDASIIWYNRLFKK